MLAADALTFTNWLLTQGPTIVFLAIGIYVVGRALLAQSVKLDTTNRERLNDHIKRIVELEDELDKMKLRLDACEDDRRVLRAELNKHINN